MPPKKKKQEQTSKKAEQKRKQKVIEDRTFGLKNKNKSKKVQQYVQGVSNNVMNSGTRQERMAEEQRKRAKADAKIRKKAAEDERNALFGEALLAVKKKKTTDQKSGKTEAKGRDGNDEANKKGTSRAMKMMYQMDAKEMEERLKEDPNYVPTLEDKIESERQKKVEELKKSGKGTKITPETFAAWQEKKRKIRAEKARKLVEAELRKKKGGKGLSVLSGKDLFEYKKDLFDVKEEDENENTDNDNNNAAGGGGEDDGKQQPTTTIKEEETTTKDDVDAVAEKVQTDLFLEGDDDDLDDLDDD